MKHQVIYTSPDLHVRILAWPDLICSSFHQENFNTLEDADSGWGDWE